MAKNKPAAPNQSGALQTQFGILVPPSSSAAQAPVFDQWAARQAFESQLDYSNDSQTQRVTPGSGTGNSPDTYNYDTDPETRRMREAQRAEDARRAADEANRQKNAITVMQSLLDSYNLSSLYGTVVDYIKNGYDADAISILIRTTPEYKQRFPAMEALNKQGRSISEAEYISYEQTASGLERRYGLPEGMLMGNVTKLLTNEVSASELNDRVLLASAAALQSPQDIKDQFQQYYGIDSGGLTAYFLDPDVATPLLEKRYASTIIGTEASRQGVGIDVYGAENLQALGVTQEQAREGFGTVAAARDLTTGRGDVVTQNELIKGTLGGDQAAQANIERARGSRVARFQQGGDFLQTQQGVVGLGSAATR